jgi:hypothetical protein
MAMETEFGLRQSREYLESLKRSMEATFLEIFPVGEPVENLRRRLEWYHAMVDGELVEIRKTQAEIDAYLSRSTNSPHDSKNAAA